MPFTGFPGARRVIPAPYYPPRRKSTYGVTRRGRMTAYRGRIVPAAGAAYRRAAYAQRFVGAVLARRARQMAGRRALGIRYALRARG